MPNAKSVKLMSYEIKYYVLSAMTHSKHTKVKFLGMCQNISHHKVLSYFSIFFRHNKTQLSL